MFELIRHLGNVRNFSHLKRMAGTLCETVPDLRKEKRKNRFAWVIHGNGIQILNRESQ
jgi:hypothetical protein